MSAQRLGLAPALQVAVWVVWCDAGLQQFVAWLTGLGRAFTCPECGVAIDLYRQGGVCQKAVETPGCLSVSDRCAACQAQIHFDATPAERRASLHWPKVAVGAGLRPPRTQE